MLVKGLIVVDGLIGDWILILLLFCYGDGIDGRLVLCLSMR